MATKTLFKVVKEGSTAGLEIKDTDGAVTVLVDGTQILAEQGAVIAAATGTADASAAVNLVIAELKRHGLIASA